MPQRRDRVTIDLRESGTRVRELAAAQGLPLASCVRRVLRSALDAGPDPAAEGAPDVAFDQASIVKITLRISAEHALLLKRRSRVAGLSQSAYVAELIGGASPPAAARDVSETLRTLSRATDQLAVIGTDLNAFVRAVLSRRGDRVEAFRERIDTLCSDVQAHLRTFSTALAEIEAALPRRSVRRSGAGVARDRYARR